MKFSQHSNINHTICYYHYVCFEWDEMAHCMKPLLTFLLFVLFFRDSAITIRIHPHFSLTLDVSHDRFLLISVSCVSLFTKHWNWLMVRNFLPIEFTFLHAKTTFTWVYNPVASEILFRCVISQDSIKRKVGDVNIMRKSSSVLGFNEIFFQTFISHTYTPTHESGAYKK